MTFGRESFKWKQTSPEFGMKFCLISLNFCLMLKFN